MRDNRHPKGPLHERKYESDTSRSHYHHHKRKKHKRHSPEDEYEVNDHSKIKHEPLSPLRRDEVIEVHGSSSEDGETVNAVVEPVRIVKYETRKKEVKKRKKSKRQEKSESSPSESDGYSDEENREEKSKKAKRNIDLEERKRLKSHNKGDVSDNDSEVDVHKENGTVNLAKHSKGSSRQPREARRHERNERDRDRSMERHRRREEDRHSNNRRENDVQIKQEREDSEVRGRREAHSRAGGQRGAEYRVKEEPRDMERSRRERGRDDNRDRRPRGGSQEPSGSRGGNRRGKRRTSPEHEAHEWGGKSEVKKEKEGPAVDKQKPNFALSGKLAEDTNMFNGVLIKYSEPPEARKPKRRWRLYPFKGDQGLPTLYIHRQSAYLMGRDRKVVDIPIDHPSCSKQHAALQYRLVTFERANGSVGKQIKLYIIDLESANGTFINNNKVEAKKYVELFEKDVIKFGFSSREYVLLHEHSKDDEDDEDDE